ARRGRTARLGGGSGRDGPCGLVALAARGQDEVGRGDEGGKGDVGGAVPGLDRTRVERGGHVGPACGRCWYLYFATTRQAAQAPHKPATRRPGRARQGVKLAIAVRNRYPEASSHPEQQTRNKNA